ncbi:MAG: aminomethyl-transferring glycine dehydrogenase subunit GcvPB [Thermoplasmata archaeon]
MSGGYRQARYEEPLLRELDPGSELEPLPPGVVPPSLERKELALPQLTEVEVVRHFLRLSQMNYGVDTGPYPLGSCTMKYNPKICEEIAGWPEVADLHPYQDEATVQGALRLMYELGRYLCELSGMDAITLQPAAGAAGEYTGMMIARAYHEENGELERRKQVVLPDTAHGTNPASAAMAGFDVVEIPSKDGCVDLDALRAAVSDRTAAFMLTNPNTLGIFEERVLEIAKIVHDAGALLYYDGANLNAIMGRARPGDMNYDIVHFNLHKTFATPHGGGGPGAGPVGVKKPLEPFLPVPIVEFDGEKYYFDYDRPKSIGKVKGLYGNFGVLVRAYIYIRLMGASGLRKASEMAVLNSNYLRARLERHFHLPHRQLRKHEFVLSGEGLKKKGLRTLDLAKRLLDYGFHAPTIYFPQIVSEALMIEPTESESKQSLDALADAMIRILDENPELVKTAPHSCAVRRVDDVQAARQPILTWRDL